MRGFNGRSPLLAGVAFATLIAGCAGAPAASPSPAASATPLVTTQPTATPAPSGPQLLRMGRLAAGQYATKNFVPTLVLTLPDGWSQFFQDEYDQIFMGSADGELAIARAAQVEDPVSHSAVDAPDDLMEWLTQHPAFDQPQPVAIELAGVDSYYVDLAGPTADTDIFAFAGGNFHIPPGVATRVYVLPWEGPDISFVILPKAANTAATEAAIEAAHPIVASVQIGD